MADNNKLVTNDFSKQSIDQAVRRRVLEHPLSTFSLVAASLGGLASFALVDSAVLLVASVAAGVLGVGTLAVNWFGRRDSLAAGHVARIQRDLERRRTLLLEKTRSDLLRLAEVGDLAVYAKQGCEQFSRMDKKMKTFNSLLASKLDPTELMYGRVLGTAEQLSVAVVENLKAVGAALETAANIDPAYIAERLNHLSRLANPAPADERERETLKARTGVRQRQIDRANELLTINEEAMTQMDLAMESFTETRVGGETVSAETSRRDLEDLMKRIRMICEREQ